MVTRKRHVAFAMLSCSALVVTTAGCGPSGTSSDQAEVGPSASASQIPVGACDKVNLTTVNSGFFTVATGSPAKAPYFDDNDPKNGDGFESAMAYAIADALGFSRLQVVWETASATDVVAPGDKTFDFAIDQIALTPKLTESVSVSDSYYEMNQALIAVKGSRAAGAGGVDDLSSLALGALGTVSLDYTSEVVQPSSSPRLFLSVSEALRALDSGAIDGLIVDLPEVTGVTSADPDVKAVGQFMPGESPEQFVLALALENPLAACVNEVIKELTVNGTLAALQQVWLADGRLPTLAP